MLQQPLIRESDDHILARTKTCSLSSTFQRSFHKHSKCLQSLKKSNKSKIGKWKFWKSQVRIWQKQKLVFNDVWKRRRYISKARGNIGERSKIYDKLDEIECQIYCCCWRKWETWSHLEKWYSPCQLDDSRTPQEQHQPVDLGNLQPVIPGPRRSRPARSNSNSQTS